eukprot:458090_1
MSAALRGKQIAFTGTFENMNRAAVVAKAKSAGALVLGRGATVSKNIDVLVTGDSNVGVKKVQAKHLGIEIVPASSFTRFIQGGGASRMTRAAAPLRLAAPVRRQQRPTLDFEEDFEAEEETTELMPWEIESAPVARMPRRVAPVARQQMKFKPAKAVRAAPIRAVAPAVRRAAYRPFWELRGRNVAFTGSFEQLKKTEATVMAERNGAYVMNGMGAQIDILVCGKGCEAKRMLAKKKGIMAVSEHTFIAACRK